MIDFIGQQGPTSKWKLAGLDLALLLLQLTMVAVHAKRRELKKIIARITGGSSPSTTTTASGETPGAEPSTTASTTAAENAAREQDADAEERGVLRRTDSLSDTGADPDDEEDALLSSSDSPHNHVDALDMLISGQCLVGEFTLIDTLLQEHAHYQAHRQTRTDAGATNSIPLPNTLRQLHSIRVRFGVGGG
jgi:hypothetical protein